MTHHSGLPGDLNQGMWSDSSFTDITTRLNQEYAAYPPGFVFGYSKQVNGREVMVVMDNGRRQLFGEKVANLTTGQAVGPGIGKAWRQRFGDYSVINANPAFPIDKVCLHEKDGLLYYSYRMPKLSPYPISIAITPVSDTEAVVAGIGRARGGTVQVVEVGGQIRLRYSGHEAVLTRATSG